jgi:hypothetical protein
MDIMEMNVYTACKRGEYIEEDSINITADFADVSRINKQDVVFFKSLEDI